MDGASARNVTRDCPQWMLPVPAMSPGIARNGWCKCPQCHPGLPAIDGASARNVTRDCPQLEAMMGGIRGAIDRIQATDCLQVRSRLPATEF